MNLNINFHKFLRSCACRLNLIIGMKDPITFVEIITTRPHDYEQAILYSLQFARMLHLALVLV